MLAIMFPKFPFFPELPPTLLMICWIFAGSSILYRSRTLHSGFECPISMHTLHPFVYIKIIILDAISSENVKPGLDERHKKEVQYQDHTFVDFKADGLLFELAKTLRIKIFPDRSSKAFYFPSSSFPCLFLQ